jgi:hypothetical protein
MDNPIINNATTIRIVTFNNSKTIASIVLSSSSSLAQSSTELTARMMQIRSSYDMIALFGTVELHNIAAIINMRNTPEVYYASEPKYTASRYVKANNNTLLSLAAILKSISDDKSLLIFLMIAEAYPDGAMMKTDLIKRHSGRYFLTPFGKVIFGCITITTSALSNYYKIKTIERTEEGDLNEEFTKLVDALIENPHVKQFLTKKCEDI